MSKEKILDEIERLKTRIKRLKEVKCPDCLLRGEEIRLDKLWEDFAK